jgi:formate dehydrogenase subunit beta
MQDTVKNWLKQGTVDIFLGYKSLYGHPLPHCFFKEKLEEVDELIEGPARYPLEKIATHIVSQKPEIKIGMLSRDCNQRALKVLTIWNKLNPDNFKTLTVNCCPSNLKKHADCSYLEPEASGIYKKQVGIDNTLSLEAVEAYSSAERFSRWMYEFQKCLKCYGCRNICPVCFCEDCSLEHHDLIGTGTLPPDVPIFHLVRAVHMAGRCIDCGLCEDACPVDIPLRLLYRKIHDIFSKVFDYETGVSEGQSPFNIIGSKVTLETKAMHKKLEGNTRTNETVNT